MEYPAALNLKTEKNPPERQAEIPEIFLPHEQTRWRWSSDPTDLKIALNTPSGLLGALGLVSWGIFQLEPPK